MNNQYSYTRYPTPAPINCPNGTHAETHYSSVGTFTSCEKEGTWTDLVIGIAMCAGLISIMLGIAYCGYKHDQLKKNALNEENANDIESPLLTKKDTVYGRTSPTIFENPKAVSDLNGQQNPIYQA